LRRHQKIVHNSSARGEKRISGNRAGRIRHEMAARS